MKTFRSTCEAGLLMGKIKSAYQELGRDKDVMIVVGAGSMLSGKYCNLDGVSIVRALDLYAIGRDYSILSCEFTLYLLEDQRASRCIAAKQTEE